LTHDVIVPEIISLAKKFAGYVCELNTHFAKASRPSSFAAADVFSAQSGSETLCAAALGTIRTFESPAPSRQ